MKTLDRYLFKQVAMATIAGILLFIVVWISPEILFKIIKKVSTGDITPIVGLKLFFLEVPEILGRAIPVGLLLGTLFSFDRLSRDFELIIMRGVGAGIYRLAAPVIVLSVICSFLCFFTYEKFIPYSTNKIKELKGETSTSQFVYVDRNSNAKPKQIIIVGDFDGKKMEKIKLIQFSKTQDDESMAVKDIVIADNAIFKDDYWLLTNGKTYNISPYGVYENIEDFNEMKVFDAKSSNIAYSLLNFSMKKHDEMNLSQLNSYLSLLKNEDMQDEFRYFLNKLYQRYAQAFSCIVLGIGGIILGISRPREKRFLGFTVAAFIIFMYYMTMPFLDMLAQKGVLPPVIAAWLPCTIIAVLLGFIAKRKEL